jgi:hypothetical protein
MSVVVEPRYYAGVGPHVSATTETGRPLVSRVVSHVLLHNEWGGGGKHKYDRKPIIMYALRNITWDTQMRCHFNVTIVSIQLTPESSEMHNLFLQPTIAIMHSVISSQGVRLQGKLCRMAVTATMLSVELSVLNQQWVHNFFIARNSYMPNIGRQCREIEVW